jgi:hypothetical protein
LRKRQRRRRNSIAAKETAKYRDNAPRILNIVRKVVINSSRFLRNDRCPKLVFLAAYLTCQGDPAFMADILQNRKLTSAVRGLLGLDKDYVM